jgi:hypothetical protein
MTSRKTTDWMWAQASDLLDQVERMHRQLFHLATPGREYVIWEPPVDVFESELELIIIIALPGHWRRTAIQTLSMLFRKMPRSSCHCVTRYFFRARSCLCTSAGNRQGKAGTRESRGKPGQPYLVPLIYGRQIFLGRAMHPLGAMWSYALLTMIIILTPAVINGNDIATAFWIRLMLFIVIAVYGTIAVAVVDAFWPNKQVKAVDLG